MCCVVGCLVCCVREKLFIGDFFVEECSFQRSKTKDPNTRLPFFLKNEDKGVDTYVSGNKIRTTANKSTFRNVLFRL